MSHLLLYWADRQTPDRREDIATRATFKNILLLSFHRLAPSGLAVMRQPYLVDLCTSNTTVDRKL